MSHSDCDYAAAVREILKFSYRADVGNFKISSSLESLGLLLPVPCIIILCERLPSTSAQSDSWKVHDQLNDLWRCFKLKFLIDVHFIPGYHTSTPISRNETENYLHEGELLRKRTMHSDIMTDNAWVSAALTSFAIVTKIHISYWEHAQHVLDFPDILVAYRGSLEIDVAVASVLSECGWSQIPTDSDEYISISHLWSFKDPSNPDSSLVVKFICVST